MSYAIIRMEKYNSKAVKGIEIHNTRSKDSLSNPDIDHSKSDQNYALLECKNYTQKIQERLDQRSNKRKVRADAVVMCQFIITSDNEFFKTITAEQERDYFERAVKFIANRYGQDNLISAEVHKDERTPHLHVQITPIRNGKLCAKEIFNKTEMKALQTDFANEVGTVFGLKRGESRENKRKHLSVEDYKNKTKQEQLILEQQALKQADKELKAIRQRQEEEKERLRLSIIEVDKIIEEKTKYGLAELETTFNAKIAEKNKELEKKTDEINKLDTKIEEKNNEGQALVDKKNRELKILKAQIKETNNELEENNNKLNKLDDKITEKNKELEKKNDEIKVLDTKIEEKNNENNRLGEYYEREKKQIDEKLTRYYDNSIKEMSLEINSYANTVIKTIDNFKERKNELKPELKEDIRKIEQPNIKKIIEKSQREELEDSELTGEELEITIAF